MKVKCEMLIPAAEHRVFLTSWETLVAGTVSLEYEKTKVEESRHRAPPRRRTKFKAKGETKEGMIIPVLTVQVTTAWGGAVGRRSGRRRKKE